jgi:hypothetical protein
MISDYADDFEVKFADAVAIKQVAEAMIEFTYEQKNLCRKGNSAQFPIHRICRGNRCEVSPKFGQLRHICNVKFDTHEEATVGPVIELLRIDYVAIIGGQAIRNCGYQTGPVVALEGQGASFSHRALACAEAWGEIDRSADRNSHICSTVYFVRSVG